MHWFPCEITSLIDWKPHLVGAIAARRLPSPPQKPFAAWLSPKSSVEVYKVRAGSERSDRATPGIVGRPTLSSNDEPSGLAAFCCNGSQCSRSAGILTHKKRKV